MAKQDLQSFLEDRLRALDPTVDLDTGSPAQVQFIEPVLKYLGTDPFETDIQSFITDRFSQEFPDIFAGDPGVVRDVFIKPMILLLEPFKREIQSTKKNQSLADPTVLSDDEADALVANVFDERDPGGFATGTGRLIFQNPTNQQIEITNRFFTADGLGFFPSNPVSITAEEMAFNRIGSQYFFDVPLKAEKEGSEYNIDVGILSGVDGVFGAVRVTNTRKFANGSPKVDTPTFIAGAREALNERSLNTRRGATARLNDVFQTSLGGVQIVGAGDPEMERDILVATSPGHSWITGQVAIYKQMAFVQARTIEGEETEVPTVGDTLYFYLSSTTFPTVPQASRLVRTRIVQVFAGPLTTNSPFQASYLVHWEGDLPSVTIPDGTLLEGGFSKRGTVSIGSLPDVGEVNITAQNGEVHVYGHTDIYVRPIQQTESTAVLAGVGDEKSLVERIGLSTLGLSTTKNKVTDAGINFTTAGVRPGALLSIETGDDIGVFVINDVVGSDLYLSTNLTNSQTNIRYRVIDSLTVNPFDPRILKFPFAAALANDMQTTIGSNLLQLSTNDVISYGAVAGDIVRILTGDVAGDYTITGFDSVLGGQGILVDRELSSSLSDLSYEVFTAQEKVLRPLVRIKEMLLLDSSNQSTGIAIPFADPVGVVPTSDFSSARVKGGSARSTGFVLPSFATTSLTTYISGANVAAVSGDRRYSLGFDVPEGTYKPVQFPDGSFAELDYRATPGSGVGDALDPASYFVATSEFEDKSENFPPIDPKPGDALRIKTGLNAGSYLIQSVVKFKHKLNSPNRVVWTYFIKIHGQFPYDVFGQLFDFLNDAGGGGAVTELPITASVTFPDYFVNLYNSLGTKLNAALALMGVSSPPSAGTLQAAIASQAVCEYEWGDPARGVLRTFFAAPTLFEMQTGGATAPFKFVNENNEVIKFQPDPTNYTEYELVPPRLDADADQKEYPTDLEVGTILNYNTLAGGFTVGNTLTGAVSGATALITDQPGAGQLELINVNGTFVVGEQVTDTAATANVVSLAAGRTFHFTDSSRAPMSTVGVKPGDEVQVFEEVFFHGTNRFQQTAVQTTQGLNQVVAPATSGAIFTSDMVGNLLEIEDGADAGMYRVSGFLTSSTLVIDKTLTESTPVLVAQGVISSWGNNGTSDRVLSTGFDFAPYVGKYITLYGIYYEWQGSYEVTGAPSLGVAVINKTPDFPAIGSLPAPSDAHFVITESPSAPPSTKLRGTKLHGLRSIRMYESNAKKVEIIEVTQNDLSISKVRIAASPTVRNGFEQPFRIVRKNIRRITPSEMDSKKFGPLNYFDTEVVSLSPLPSANISKDSYLTLEDGSYTGYGYRHVVADRTLTYSTKEEGTLEISPKLLPVGSSDSQDNFLNIIGSSVQVSYEQSELVQQVQDFVDSAQDRITSANFLVRHFLPAYISYDAEYVGGSATSVIADDIIAYLENIAVETPIDVSEVQALIDARGGNPITPTFVQTLLHDWKRKTWLEFSDNQLGGSETSVPYDGTPRVSCYVAGPDKSQETEATTGERIKLTRR